MHLTYSYDQTVRLFACQIGAKTVVFDEQQWDRFRLELRTLQTHGSELTPPHLWFAYSAATGRFDWA